jgi:type VI secretion system VasD/TssJ family lipoprotein
MSISPRRSVTARAAVPLLLCISIALTGCSSLNSMFGGNSSEDALAKLKWDYSEKGVHVNWTASTDLNVSGGDPHSLLLTVLQMPDPNVFRQAAASSQGLSALLSAATLPTGFTSMQRIFIQPGKRGDTWLPRAEGTRYVAVIAGYYSLDTARVTRLYRVGADVDSKGWFVKTRTAEPLPLDITLELGSDGLLGGTSAPAEAPSVDKPTAGEVALDGNASTPQ